jgi:hypothetical protein
VHSEGRAFDKLRPSGFAVFGASSDRDSGAGLFPTYRWA